MTKAQIRFFCAKQGWTCNYSGRSIGMYIDPHNVAVSLDDVEVAVVQYFGILPDFKLFRM